MEDQYSYAEAGPAYAADSQVARSTRSPGMRAAGVPKAPPTIPTALEHANGTINRLRAALDCLNDLTTRLYGPQLHAMGEPERTPQTSAGISDELLSTLTRLDSLASDVATAAVQLNSRL